MSRKKSRATRKSAAPTPSPWMTWWQRQSESRQHGIAICTLALVSFGFFAPIHFSSLQLIRSDTVQWISMANAMISYEAQTGEPALWSPNTFGGMPGFMVYYKDLIPQVDSLVGAMRSFMWPSSHFLVLLLGMYLLTWYLTDNKLGGLFSAVAFGLTTYLPVILTAGHNTKFIALAWAPWLLLAFIYALRKPSLKAGLLFAIALAVNLRADHVQITYYTLFVAGIWWIVEGIQAHRTDALRSFWRATGWLFLGSFLATLMIAQPYLAQYQYKGYSVRGLAAGGEPGGMLWSQAMAWSQGFGELLTLLVSDAFGGGSQYYWGPKPFTAGPHYLGGLVIVLCILMFIRKRDATTVGLGLAGLLMLLFSLGEHLPLINRPMFSYFPLFSAFRVPETWLAAVAMVTAILAGRALADLITSDRSAASKKPAYMTFGIVIGALLLLLLIPNIGLDFERSNEHAQLFQQVQSHNTGISESDPRVQEAIGQEINRRKLERTALFEKDAQRTVFFLGLGIVIVVLFFGGKIPGWLAGWAFILLIILDLGGVGRRYINENILTTSREPAAEVPEAAFDEFILDRIEEAGGPGHLRVLSFEGDRDPSVNARPSYFYESMGGYHGAKLRLYQDYLDQILFNPTTGALNPTALSMMNIRYVVGRRAVPGYEMAFQDDDSGNTVFENPDVLPRAFFVSAIEVESGAEATWNRLRSPDFDPSRVAILARDSGLSNAPIDSTSTVRAELITHTPRELTFDVETDAGRWLVISEVYYPAGWMATIDGEPVSIERADYLLRAVFVPAGAHRIHLRFEPAAHTWGVRLSAISTMLVYGGLLLLVIPGWIRRYRDPVAS